MEKMRFASRASHANAIWAVVMSIINPTRIEERNRAVRLSFVGGILLIFGGVVSFDILSMLGINIDFVALGRAIAARYFSGQYKDIIAVIFVLLTFVISLGGFAVIAGGAAVRLNAARAGRVLMQLGGGSGIFGLVIFVIIMLVGNPMSLEAAVSGTSAVGTVFAFMASRRARKMLELPEVA